MAARAEALERVRKALGDQHLRGAVRYTAENLYMKRKAAMADLDAQAARGDAIGNFEELRARAREIKLHTLAHLDGYLKQAADQIRKNGGVVHWARDAEEANQIVLEICRKRGARKLIKSKSMVSEEIHLNQHLEAEGLEIVESDLGEYIIQLAHETPAHIVIPAIHKTRRQIADLFGAVAGHELPTDTKSLTAFARATLRHKFMTADVGVTGANFVVAETGTICLVTNEGNGRLTTSVPPCQITLVGMEKLVPRLEDLAVMMALLPRSATGQKITTYFNMITGPRRPGEPDGPEELHVIFLDNGRSQILGSRYEEVLTCIRCGACLNSCPVYRQLGGHAYGSTYPGPIGSVLTPLLQGLEEWEELPQLCSLCGACHENCPLGIHLHEYIIQLRGELVARGRENPLMRTALKLVHFAWTRPGVYRFVAGSAHLGTKPFTRKRKDGSEYLDNLPSIAAGWTMSRTMPAPARRPFHQRWAELERQGGAK
ncbi:MAG: LutB/LldF family L-lactate oxidation iron-sulfur protein [Symbiobacterium sp.]|uniref:LutB/LldF family L-lactate oxidation iron-sulfur protein n=1 Tax=Symbiobacterium sp. TaxID=1971213 RepID=UPI003463F87D